MDSSALFDQGRLFGGVKMGWGDWGNWSDVPCNDLIFVYGRSYKDGYGAHEEITEYSVSQKILRVLAHVLAFPREVSYSVAEVGLITNVFQVEESGNYTFTVTFERYGWVDYVPLLVGAFTSLTLAEQQPPYNQETKNLEDYRYGVSGQVTISKTFYLEKNKPYVIGFNLSCYASKAPIPLKFASDFYGTYAWRGVKIHDFTMCFE